MGSLGCKQYGDVMKSGWCWLALLSCVWPWAALAGFATARVAEWYPTLNKPSWRRPIGCCTRLDGALHHDGGGRLAGMAGG